MEKINEGAGAPPPLPRRSLRGRGKSVRPRTGLGMSTRRPPSDSVPVGTGGCLGAVRPGLNAEANARLVALPDEYEALRVFAALGNEVPSTLLDDKPLYAIGSSKEITAGDLRRATAALAEAEGRPSGLGPAPQGFQMTNEELVIDNARLRALLSTCRAEVMRVKELLAKAEERAAEAVKLYAAIDALTAAKLYAARLEKQLSGGGGAVKVLVGCEFSAVSA
jgi:hypothetical protein